VGKENLLLDEMGGGGGREEKDPTSPCPEGEKKTARGEEPPYPCYVKKREGSVPPSGDQKDRGTVQPQKEKRKKNPFISQAPRKGGRWGARKENIVDFRMGKFQEKTAAGGGYRREVCFSGGGGGKGKAGSSVWRGFSRQGERK